MQIPNRKVKTILESIEVTESLIFEYERALKVKHQTSPLEPVKEYLTNRLEREE